MRKALLAIACAVGLVFAVATPANAYLIFQGVFDETIVTSTLPARANTDCWLISSTSYACETKRTSTLNAAQRVFADRIYTRNQYSSRQIAQVDDTHACYDRGRPVGSVNVIYSCFTPVPIFP